jgi:hypothetical protein
MKREEYTVLYEHETITDGVQVAIGRNQSYRCDSQLDWMGTVTVY